MLDREVAFGRRADEAPEEAPEEVEVQWVRDSAYRFFPLLEHPELGLTLHPFDLATNKVLALVGRIAVRDWVDILTCHRTLSPLGCLAWAPAGKEPGLRPASSSKRPRPPRTTPRSSSTRSRSRVLDRAMPRSPKPGVLRSQSRTPSSPRCRRAKQVMRCSTQRRSPCGR